jgi:hypothetical protein
MNSKHLETKGGATGSLPCWLSCPDSLVPNYIAASLNNGLMNPAASPLTSAMNRNQGQTGWGGNREQQGTAIWARFTFTVRDRKTKSWSSQSPSLIFRARRHEWNDSQSQALTVFTMESAQYLRVVLYCRSCRSTFATYESCQILLYISSI